MPLVVAHGLRNYYDYGDDVEGACKGLHHLVKAGYTTLVREVFPAKRTSGDLKGARVLEVARAGRLVQERWLAGKEARELLDALAAVYAKHDSLASFAWVQLERMPSSTFLQPLAFVLDGAKEPAPKGIKLPGQDRPLGVLDVRISASLWTSRSQSARIAVALHKIAETLRLVVRTG